MRQSYSDSSSSSIMDNTTSPPQVTLASFLPATLQANGVVCTDETPKTLEELLSRNKLEVGDFIESSPDIAMTLIDAFIEDDFDGKLHLMTLSNAAAGGGGGNDGHEIIGISFWREVDDGEMRNWFDIDRVTKMIDKSIEQIHGHEHESLKLVRRSSINWIQKALESTDNNYISRNTQESTIQQLTHAWVKIELIAIKQSYREHHLGHTLLGCTLAKAHQRCGDHVILHVAGGALRIFQQQNYIKNLGSSLYRRIKMVEYFRSQIVICLYLEILVRLWKICHSRKYYKSNNEKNDHDAEKHNTRLLTHICHYT